jgi:hypothetical protein
MMGLFIPCVNDFFDLYWLVKLNIIKLSAVCVQIELSNSITSDKNKYEVVVYQIVIAEATVITGKSF